MTLVGYPLSHGVIEGNVHSEKALSILDRASVPFGFCKAPEGVHGDNPSNMIRLCPALIIKDEQSGMSYIIEGIDKIEKFVEHWRSCEDKA